MTVQPHLAQDSRSMMKEWKEYKSWKTAKSGVKFYPCNDMEAECMNSQKTWLSTQDLDKIKKIKNSSMADPDLRAYPWRRLIFPLSLVLYYL